MARDERKRQKQLEKKKAKRHEALARKQADSADGLPRDLERIAASPITECWLTEGIFERGIGQATIARAVGPGRLAVAAFLFDTYCLGIKNALAKVMSESEYRELLRQTRRGAPIVAVAPAYVAKLARDLEAWARLLGFEPHPDYPAARRILAGVAPEECAETFTFGKDGKPFYISGPHDRPFRITQIMNTLTRTCGTGNFEYLVHVGSSKSITPASAPPAPLLETSHEP